MEPLLKANNVSIAYKLGDFKAFGAGVLLIAAVIVLRSFGL